MTDTYEEYHDAIVRLSRDLRAAAETLSDREARYLVRQYYLIQKQRIRAANQERKLTEFGDPHLVLSWLRDQSFTLERQIQAALDRYTSHHDLGEWPRRVVGVGPVICAGLLANSHWEHLTTPGHLWAFAGLDPSKIWKPGELRPWNNDLKVVCFHAGESFVKLQSHPRDFYGKLFVERRAFEERRSNRGHLTATAEAALKRFKYEKDTEAYKAYSQGQLPKAHLHARARRWAVKLFLSHYWEVSYRKLNGDAPKPYPIGLMGHTHYVPPPYTDDAIEVADAIAHFRESWRT